ncbi:MAG: sigma-70 family RNA polymerase sigma factor [Planctomycetaceae bacterium]|nr:sigma-70 family RNA polymerase sigma factor [Planctomycetales bacterium]MCB9922164.1 sigma-70 family RNA polymerase sigma factor [Planctomycetaceae bacterium]
MPASPPETRASLILRLQNAEDAAAWDQFVELYGPVVYRSARGRGLQAADAENLVQEVLLAVMQSVSKWLLRDDRGSFRAWLLRIARNEVVNMLTLRATRSLGEDGDDALRKIRDLPVVDEISELVDLEYRRAVFRWAAERVQQAIAPRTWQAFWLTHVEGLSVEQAATQLGTRPGNIHFGRSRVMARIRQLVGQYEERNV